MSQHLHLRQRFVLLVGTACVYLLFVCNASAHMKDDEGNHGTKTSATSEVVLTFNKNDSFASIEGAIAQVCADDSKTAVTLIGNNVTEAHFASLAQARRLRKVSIVSNSITDKGVRFAAELCNLEELDLHSERVNGETLAELSILPALTRLNLASCKISRSGAVSLGSLIHLRDLSLENTGITDEQCQQLATLVLLERLNLSSNDLTVAGLGALRKLRQLRELSLPFSLDTGAGLSALPSLPNLRAFHLSQVSETQLDALANFGGIETLSFDSLDLTSRGMQRIAALPRLTTLRLFRGSVPEGLEVSLSRCFGLRDFQISSSRIPKGVTRALAALPRLTTVDFSDSVIEDDDIEAFRNAPNITEVRLRDTKLTDRSIAIIATCPSLRLLDIRGCKVTPAGIRALHRVRTLEVLGCKPDGIQVEIFELKKVNPHLHVTNQLW